MYKVILMSKYTSLNLKKISIKYALGTLTILKMPLFFQ